MRIGLRARLLLLVSLAVLPAIALLVWQAWERREQRADELARNVLDLAHVAAHAQERRLEGARQLLIAISRASEIRAGAATCTRFVRDLAALYRGTYTEIGWADASGRVMCHALDGPANVSIADRFYFTHARDTGEFTVGERIRGRISGASAVAFAMPMRTAAGVFEGVVFANVDLTAFSRTLRDEWRETTTIVSVLDRNGTVLARAPDDPGVASGMRRASDAQLTAIRRRRELIAEFTGSDGVPRVYGIAAVRGNGTESVMFVTVGAPRATLLAGIDRQLRLELLAFAALALGILGSAAIVVEWVVRRPVARLIDATAKLAAGHLETRIDRVAGMPELAVLGVAFNDMAGKLEERERQLRQGQRLEAIGQLAGGVAHDFNNLLQVIIGYCEMLQAQVPPGSRSAADVAQVRAAADTAAGLTRQLLAFGRRQLLQPQPVTLNEVVSGMTSLIEHTMGSNIRIVTVFEPTPCVVLADPAQMEQVILNLALNARDAMPEGGEMRLETIATDVPDGYRRSGALVPRGEYVVLRISDTGMGMSDAVRERIFEPFFTTKGAAGNGLGLATVYGIVKQSGGFIFCESALGRGTRFEVFLPRTSEVVPTAAKPVVAGPERGAERILVVDDQDNVRQLLAQLLRQRGYRVLETGRPEEALDWIRAGTALDLLITDVRMPDMSGPQLAEHVLRLRPGVPVMFISGYASDHGDAASAGSRFLQKPFSPDDLLRKVREMLRTDPQPAV